MGTSGMEPRTAVGMARMQLSRCGAPESNGAKSHVWEGSQCLKVPRRQSSSASMSSTCFLPCACDSGGADQLGWCKDGGGVCGAAPLANPHGHDGLATAPMPLASSREARPCPSAHVAEAVLVGIGHRQKHASHQGAHAQVRIT